MSDVVRAEEWTIEEGWGVSTLIMDVYLPERVQVSDPYVQEFGLSIEDGEEDSNGFRQSWFYWFPYETVKAALIEHGYSYAGAS